MVASGVCVCANVIGLLNCCLDLSYESLLIEVELRRTKVVRRSCVWQLHAVVPPGNISGIVHLWNPITVDSYKEGRLHNDSVDGRQHPRHAVPVVQGRNAGTGKNGKFFFLIMEI